MRRTVVTVIALCVVGCGEPSAVDVTGRVTYNGAALNKTGGQIVFVDAKGTQVVADIGPDGAYRAAGVPAGPARVAVYYPNPEFKKAEKPLGQKAKAMPPPFLTPYKYASPDTSELAVTVGPGTVFDVAMTGPPLQMTR